MTDNDRIELTVTRLLSARLNSLEKEIGGLSGKLDQIIEIKTSIKELERVVYGNGDTEGGLVGKLDKAMDWIGDQKKLQFALAGGIIANILGLLFLFIAHALPQ